MKTTRNKTRTINSGSRLTNPKMSHFGATLACAIFAFAVTAAADVTLIKDGTPVSDIVIAADAPRGVKLAAEDLQKHLKLISGAEVPIVDKPSANVANHVYVGPSEFTRKLGFKPTPFTNSGLEILAKDNHVILDGPLKHWKPSPYRQSRSDSKYLKGSIITGDSPEKPEDFPSPGLKAWQDFCGEKFTTAHLNNGPGDFNEPLEIYTNDDIGPWYAVAELLEQLGVRWYMPYEHGTVIPEIKTVVIPGQHLTKEADFGRREWCYYRTRRVDGEGISWLKRLKAGNYRMILYNHTTYAIYSSYEQHLLHPEYLSKNSKGAYFLGYPSGCGMPRYPHPGFRKAAVTYMNKVFEAQPALWAMSVGTPDGGFKLDARDIGLYGKPGDSIKQKASNAVWDFHMHLCKELKKSHPDKYLLYFTGYGAREVPTNIDEVPDNLLVRGGSFSPASSWVLDTHRREKLAAHKKWTDATGVIKRTPTWDHWLSYRRPGRPRYPVVFTKALQDQMRTIKPFIDGKFIEIQPSIQAEGEDGVKGRLGVPGLVHLMVYWQNRLFWDADADREKMLDEYYRLFFGPAEAEMREFYEFAEKVWSRQESRSVTQSEGFLKEADVDRYFDILARARAKAGEDTVYDKRIAMIENKMQSLKKLFPNLKRTGPWVRAYRAHAPNKIDGDLSKYKYGWKKMKDLKTGEVPKENLTRAVITMPKDKSALIVGVICYENKMPQLKADCKINDDRDISRDDAIEVYVNTPERSYFKIVVNPNNAVWTESTDVAIIERETLPILWNPAVESVAQQFDDRWTVEIKIPTDDFGKLGPSKTFPWGIQVGRTRFTAGAKNAWAIAPTDGPYKTMNRWGNLWVR